MRIAVVIGGVLGVILFVGFGATLFWSSAFVVWAVLCIAIGGVLEFKFHKSAKRKDRIRELKSGQPSRTTTAIIRDGSVFYLFPPLLTSITLVGVVILDGVGCTALVGFPLMLLMVYALVFRSRKNGPRY